MRIIAGKNRSRKLETLPGEDTRPTLDQVKEAVFSSLGPTFQGQSFLDLFSGSGAMGLEALSRGCKEATLVDANPQAMAVIKRNIATLQEEGATCLTLEATRALDQLAQEGKSFDFIYLDPPYATGEYEKLLTQISQQGIVKEKGIVVCESKNDRTFPETLEDLVLTKQKKYGTVRITYYRKRRPL